MSEQASGDAVRVFGYVFWGVMGINACLGMVALLRRSRGLPAFSPRWSLADLWFGLQATLFVLVALTVPAVLVAVALTKPSLTDMSDPDTIRFVVLPGGLLQAVPFVLVPLFYIGAKWRVPLRDIGLPPLPQKRHIVAGVIIGLGAALLTTVLHEGILALARMNADVPWIKAALETERTNPVALMIKALPRLGFWTQALAFVVIAVAAPLGEEVLFRGFVFNTLKNRFLEKPWAAPMAILVSALVFTLPHSYALGLVSVFAMGVLLAWVYHVSGSLWTCIVIHFTNNALSFVLSLLFPS